MVIVAVLWFLIGLIVGSIAGVFLIALCMASSNDRREDEDENERTGRKSLPID